jgi:HNH endonuclease
MPVKDDFMPRCDNIMNSGGPKRPRQRLDRCSYETLWGQVLRRDGWRCQGCGSLRDLQVHHIQSRSLLGDDAEENLITLCTRCHKRTRLRSSKRRSRSFKPRRRARAINVHWAWALVPYPRLGYQLPRPRGVMSIRLKTGVSRSIPRSLMSCASLGCCV